MRVALIDPPGISRGLNIGLAMIAASLKRHGHQVRTVDLNNNYRDAGGRIKKILKYDAIGISVKSFTFRSASRFAAQLGRDDLICGGPHVTLDASNVLEENRHFKAGIEGEAEEVFPELLEGWGDAKRITGPSGVVLRRDGAIFCDRSRCRYNLIPDLDALPFADYGCFDSLNGILYDYPVITSRGCPYSCIYCCVGKISGRKVRFRSVAGVVEEIANARLRYGSGSFHILDDNFNFETGRAKEFCRMLIKRNIRMSWACPNGIRADRLDEELVGLMAESGCRQASIGIESLDEEVFLNIKKGEEIRDIKNAIRLFVRHGIRVTGFFMVGLPKDNFRKGLSSLRQALKLGIDSCHWNIFTPYPGTEAWEWVNKNARVLKDWRRGCHFGPRPETVFETEDFKRGQRLHIYKVANIKCRNYSAFTSGGSLSIGSALRILLLILRYDALHLLSHLRYVFNRRRDIKRYLENS
ncbi:MAG: radical SAM protein [Candidatus Omnitrophota bacterium]